MNKNILLALLLGSAFCALPTVAQVPEIGVAASVTNKVDGAVGQQNRPVVIGDKVFENEVIRTGPNSKSQLLFRDETSLSIGPESEVTLDKFVYNAQGNNTVSLNATKGVFRFISGSLPKQAYEIKTPSATVGVRGTIVYIGLLPDGTAIFYNGEGAFDLKTLLGNISSNTPGEVIVIRPGGQPEIGKLQPWMAALFAALFDPDKNGGTVPDVPGMPDKGNDLKSLLRGQSQQEITCYDLFASSSCYSFRRQN